MNFNFDKYQILKSLQSSKNYIFVGYKPPFISSNSYLYNLKKYLSIKKMGYSGTLDPFASGTLVIASGSYTKLISHLNLEPKIYEATLWLGAKSPSLDITNIDSINTCTQFSINSIMDVFSSLKGKIRYTPPAFSAKKVNGIRAYKLIRSNKEVKLKDAFMYIFDIALLNYNHPFITFKVSVNKGAYIRSLGLIISNKLGVYGSLSNLVRLYEGDYHFNNYQLLDPLSCIMYNRLDSKDCDILRNDFYLGKKLTNNHLLFKYGSGKYIANFDDFFSIIEIDCYRNINYILNRVVKC